MAARINVSLMTGAGSTLTVGGSTFAVGHQGGALKSAASVAGSGISVNGKTVVVSKAGAVIDGFDLRGYNVEVRADNVTIKNSLFNAAGFHTVYQSGTAKGMVVEYNTFDGQKANNKNSDIIYSKQGAATIRNNEFLNLPSDAINSVGGVIEKNYIGGAGYQSGAHADAISVHSTYSALSIRQNYIDYTTPSDAVVAVTNAAIKIVPHFGRVSNVSVEGNVLLGGGYTIYAYNAEHAASGISIARNDVGLGKWGDLYPGSRPGNFLYSGNDGSLTAGSGSGGAAAPPKSSPAPSPSKPAPAPEYATPPSTQGKKTFSGTEKQDIMRGSSGSEVFYGKGGIDVITSGGGNDTIIGGRNKDWMSGQAGNDVFKLTSIADSTWGKNRDVICDWGFGKDKINIAAIDAHTGSSGNQAFKWVGSKGFSGKAGEVRSFFDGRHTIVEGNVNGDKVADFQIQLNTHVKLSASDFYL